MANDHQLRTRQIRGLLWLAALVIVFTLLRAAFTHSLFRGWWHAW
jgi:hypothetical protein